MSNHRNPEWDYFTFMLLPPPLEVCIHHSVWCKKFSSDLQQTLYYYQLLLWENPVEF